jgi:transposase
MNVTTVGLDIAKRVFYAHGVDRNGKTVMQRKLTRGKVLEFFAKLSPCLVGIEATGSAHYWARELMKFGHTVKLMPAQYVKAYVKRDKNDPNDAAGICEAVSRPSMRFVAVNTVEQQDVQMLHAIRQRMMQQRTAALNQIRGLLAEYGVVFKQGANNLRRGIAELLSREAHGLSGVAVELIQDVQYQLADLDERLAAYDARVKRVCQNDPRCRDIEALPGIGPLTATAVVAKVGDGRQFKRARQMSSCLGLTAREHSSGGKQRQYGISKRGDTYTRTLLIHGARSVLRHAAKKADPDPLLRWALGVQERRGANIAAVALANKLARIAWAVLAHGRHYDPHWVVQAA